MASENPDYNCVICFEQREDLRMLPCWHVACISCILSMTQSGQGRAVKCHTCRKPFLFENVRSLPRPVKCRACQNYVQNPIKFPCCASLYCSDCASNLHGDKDGKVVCPDICSGDARNREDLLQAKICSVCFCMNTQEAMACGHHMCEKCTSILHNQSRNCPLCQAVNTPMPLPVNPIQPTPEQMNASIQQLGDGQLQDNGQAITQMQLLSALQTVRLWQQRNPQLRPNQQQQLRRNTANQQMENIVAISAKYLHQDLAKASVVLAAVFIMTIVWGFRYWTWAVITILFSLLKPIKTHNNCVWGLFCSVMLIYAIWNYFYQCIVFAVIEWSWNFVVRRVGIKCFKDQSFFVGIFYQWSTVVKCILVYALFSPIFLHFAFSAIGLAISTRFAQNVS